MEARPARAAVWASQARSRHTPASSSESRCFGTPSASKPIGRPAGSRASSTSVTSGEATRRPASQNERSSCDGQGGEPEVARACPPGPRRRSGGARPGSRPGAMSTGLADARARSAASRPMAAASIRVASTRDLLRVAGPVVGAHGHGEELGAGPALGGADALRVGDGDRLGVRGERAEGGDAGLVRGGDDRAGTLGAELRAGGRGARPTRPRGAARRRRPRAGRPSPRAPRRCAAMAAARSTRARMPSGVHAAGARDAHAAALHEAQVDEDLAARRRSGGSRCWRTG